MKFHSWLSSCATPSTTDDNPSPPGPPPPKYLQSDSSSLSTTSQDTTSTSGTSTSSSLQNNLSLLTLPSLPSLQKLSPETLNLSVTTVPITSLKPHHALVNFLAVNENLLYAASGNAINVYEIVNFNLIDSFNAGKNSSSGSVKSISFCNGKIFTAHQDCKIRAWKFSSPVNKQSKKQPNKHHELVGTLPTFEDRFRNFWLPKNYVKVRRHRKKLWVEHHDAVSGLAMAGNDVLCSISWDKCLKIWNSKEMKCMESIKAHDDAVNAVVVSNDGIVYTGSADRRIKVWVRSETHRRLKYVLNATLEKHKSAVNALALNDEGSVLFSGSNDRSILVWEREDSANHMVVTGALRGHSKAILCLVNVSDILFSGSGDRTVRVWRRGGDGRFCCLTVLDGHVKPVRSLVAVEESSSGESSCTVKVFSGSLDGEIKVWQVVISNVQSPASSFNL